MKSEVARAGEHENNAFKHREAWLHALAEALRPLFEAAGNSIPNNIRLTCGFPSRRGTAAKRRAIGQCWADSASKDGHFEIMISPVLDAPMQVAEVVTHEIIHAVVGVDAGHKGPFSRLARRLGLEGKMTASVAGDAFKQAVIPILESLGPYPHAELTVGPSSGPRKQTTRLIKCQCDDAGCGYTVRITRRWLDQVGPPDCPWHGVMVEEERRL